MLLCTSISVCAQNTPVIFEAESGTFSPTNDVYETRTEGSIQFVRVVKDFAATQFPGNANHVVTYTVTFPEAGTYELYARLRVGPGAFSDDSYYYGNGFGTKNVTNGDHWITVNGLASGGFTTGHHIVTGGGAAQSNVWKWLNMSKFSGQGEPPISFTVSAGNLTQTFQIGSRENGLDFDKFAFGRAGVFFTVSNLDNGEAGSTTPPPPPYTPTHPPLATGKPKFLGNIYSSSQLPNFTAYWNQVTPENAGKWGSVESTRDVMNWTELDAAYKLAKDNNFPFRFHVLIWGNQQPAWIESLPQDEQLEEIEEWFAAVAARYPALDYIEVVNEPLHDAPRGAGNGNYIEALGGNGATGWDWVINSFRLARQYFPGAKLMINEYSITNNTTDAQRYINIINLLKAENLIDVIGIQGHAFSTRVAAATTKSNLDLIAGTGLPIQVTEMDIDGPDDQTQLDDYKRIVPVFWEHPSVMGITLWGYRPGMWRTSTQAYIVYENGAERPAMVWLKNYIRNNAPVITPSQVMRISEGAVNGDIAGTVLATDADAGTVFQNWQITGGTGASVFSIEPATGNVKVADRSLLDYESATSYSLRVKVSDGYTFSSEETLTLSIVNENDNAPVITVAQSFAIDAGTCNVIGSLAATDADNINQPGFTTLQNWKITGGSGAQVFAVNPNTGVISIANPSKIDFNNSSYALLVTVSDGLNTSAAEQVVITISEKLNVCHKGNNISISKNAVPAHIKQGGCLGACGSVTQTTNNRIVASPERISLSEAAIQVYPNPVLDKINVNFGKNTQQVHRVDVIDLSGRIVLQKLVNGQSSLVIPVEKLKAGVYLLRVHGDAVITYKIMKQ